MTSSFSQVRQIPLELDLPLACRNRTHELVELPNGIRALLINDAQTDLVSGVMVVGSGSFLDPPETPGVAHLCEHMLFRGTKKFPDPTLFEQTMLSAGGYTNAYTTGEQTCFHFEISTFAENNKELFILDQTLDIFSAFFTCPLFSEKYLKGEVAAVNDEHVENTASIDKILFHALRQLAKEDHPFSRFGTGNYATLSRIPTRKLRAKVVEYFESNFFSSNMVFVIKGPQSVNHLRKLVMSHFSSIPPSPKILSRGSYRLSRSSFYPFSTQRYIVEQSQQSTGQTLLYIKSSIVSKVRLCFSLHEIKSFTNYGPVLRILCNIIGDESPNSLCEHLIRERNWATLVYVFIENITTDEDILIVELDITPQGLKLIHLVLSTFFHYVEEVISKASWLQIENVVEAFQYIEDYAYLNRKSDLSSLADIQQLAERLQRNGFLKESLARGYEKWDQSSKHYLPYGEEVRLALKASLARHNLSLIICHKSFSMLRQFEAVQEIRTDSYYQYQYVKCDLGPITLNGLENNSIKFPNLNQDIRIWAPLSTLENTRIGLKIRGLAISKREPQLLRYHRNTEVWLQVLSSSNSMVVVSALYLFPTLSTSAVNLVVLDLMVEMIGEELRYQLYHGELMGSTWGIYANVNGNPSIMLTVCGTEHSIEHLATRVFDTARKQIEELKSCGYQKFKRARKNCRRRYEDLAEAKDIQRVIQASHLILDEGIVTPNDRIEALEILDREDVVSSFEDIHQGVHCSVLFSGDTVGDRCLELESKIQIFLVEDSVLGHQMKEHSSSYMIHPGTCFELRTFAIKTDTANTVFYYLQISERENMSLYTMAKVLEHIIASTALAELRTKRRVAYTVLTGTRVFRKTFGLHITIPSGQHDCSHLVQEIEHYLLVLEDIIMGYSETNFQKEVLQPFILSLNNDEGDLKAESGLFACLEPTQGSYRSDSTEAAHHRNCLNQILNSTYCFGSQHCEETIDEQLLSELRLSQFLRFFQRYVSIKSKKRSVLIISNRANLKSKEAAKAKSQQTLYIHLQEDYLSIPDEVPPVQSGDQNNQFSQKIQTPLKKRSTRGNSWPHGIKRMTSKLLPQGSTTKLNFADNASSLWDIDPITRRQVKDYRSIQRECSVVSRNSLQTKFERLMAFEDLQLRSAQ